MLDIYGENAADRQHNLEPGDLMHKLFDHHFELPKPPSDVDMFALAMELGDRVYARSVQQHGQITPRLYLPPYLHKRPTTA